MFSVSTNTRKRSNQNPPSRYRSPLAIIYNDRNVLESFHCSVTFHTMSQERFNMLKNFSAEDVNLIRRTVIDLILATDLGDHRHYMSEFKSKLTTPGLGATPANSSGAARTSARASNPPAVISPQTATITTTTISRRSSPQLTGSRRNSLTGKRARELDTPKQVLLMQMFLKSADISHPCRPQSDHLRWSGMILEEFFNQGDQEKNRQLKCSANMDRDATDKVQAQLGFIEFLVQPLFLLGAQIMHNIYSSSLSGKWITRRAPCYSPARVTVFVFTATLQYPSVPPFIPRREFLPPFAPIHTLCKPNVFILQVQRRVDGQGAQTIVQVRTAHLFDHSLLAQGDVCLKICRS